MSVLSRLSQALVVVTALVIGWSAPVAAIDEPGDVCLELASGSLSEFELATLRAGLLTAVEIRPSLFPEPSMPVGQSQRFDIWSGQEGMAVGVGAPCLEPGATWTARFGRDFLQAGAERMLAEAPTTPGIASNVTIEWYPDETRLRTILEFAGPLDIPNGQCWVDDVLSVDSATGTVSASGEPGVQTSPFAEGACGRFFDHLPDGGAGEQAVTLLPAAIDVGGGQALRFVAERVEVQEDAVVVSGSLGRD